MAITETALIARFYDRLDGISEGDPLDLLADGFTFEMCFPANESIPVERFSGRSKADFERVLRDLDSRGPRFRKSATIRRHNIDTLTVSDGLELMVGRGLGGRRNGGLVAAAQQDRDGKLSRYIVAMSSVVFPPVQERSKEVKHPSVISRFFDLLDGSVDGDPVDILSEDYEYEMVFPGYQVPEDERVAGGKEHFRQFMQGLYARGHNRRSADTERRHHFRTLTFVDGLELMVGNATGGRRQGTLVAAAQQDEHGQLLRYVVVMSSVAFLPNSAA